MELQDLDVNLLPAQAEEIDEDDNTGRCTCHAGKVCAYCLMRERKL